MGELVGIVGSGGREYAFGKSLSQSPEVDRIMFMPGNDMTEMAIPGAFNVTADPLDMIVAHNPDLIFIGPDAPLAAGLANRLDAAGFEDKVVGVRQETAFLEASKCDAGDFMNEFGILCPPFTTVTNYLDALRVINNREPNSYVLKADKLAEGKGVVLPETTAEAESIIKGMINGALFNGAGAGRIQIQERWHGPEISVFVISDGERYYCFPFISQDHKRLETGDTGPNTGGMGAYAPYTKLTVRQYEKIQESIDRTMYGLKQRGLNSKGIFYNNYMLAEESADAKGGQAGDPAMIEYNVRFGDPEAQVVIPLMTRAGIDVYGILKDSASGNLNPDKYELSSERILSQAAVTVCLAAARYPDTPVTGTVIQGYKNHYPNVDLHFAGVKFNDQDKLVTNGGRVLYVTGYGENVDEAALNAYSAIGNEFNPDKIYFPGMQYRRDIAHQAKT